MLKHKTCSSLAYPQKWFIGWKIYWKKDFYGHFWGISPTFGQFPTFPWQMLNSPTFPGFSVKCSPCTDDKYCWAKGQTLEEFCVRHERMAPWNTNKGWLWQLHTECYKIISNNSGDKNNIPLITKIMNALIQHYCKTLYFHCILISRFSYVENLLHFNLAYFPVIPCLVLCKDVRESASSYYAIYDVGAFPMRCS